MKAIVLGRNYTSRLGMIRALGSIGFDVYIIYTNATNNDPDFKSKYVKEIKSAREPDENALLDAIQTITSIDNEKILLFPIDDYCAYVIDKNIEVLKCNYLFQNVGMIPGKVIQLMDKGYQKSIAQKYGMPVSEGHAIEIINGKYSLPPTLSYPCFVKPISSHLDKKSFLRKCKNEQELDELLSLVIDKGRNTKLLVEKYIEIHSEYAIVGYCDGQKVVMPALIQMLMDGAGHHKGVTITGKVLPSSHYLDIFQNLYAMMLSTGFVGLFDIDLYESNGVMYFNELNLRLGASGWALTAKGVNLAAMLANKLRSTDNYDIGISINETYCFTNEKGLLEHFYGNYIDFKQYKSVINNTDIFFIKDNEDPAPFWEYRKQLLVSRVKRAIKNILHI